MSIPISAMDFTGVFCPHHKIPQLRVEKKHEEEDTQQEIQPQTASLNLINEIFDLQIDPFEYANFQIAHTKNIDAKAVQQDSSVAKYMQLLQSQRMSSQQRPVKIDQHSVPLSEQQQMVVKAVAPAECLQMEGREYYKDKSVKNADEINRRIICDDIEEIFLVPKRRDTLVTANDDERQKYQRFRTKQYLCDICDSAFTLKHNIQTHLLLYHPNNESYTQRRRGKRYRCLKCNMMFRTLDSVQRHQKRQHEVRMRPKCETCDKEFPTSSLLREHIAVVHLNLRPFKCNKCSAVFGRQGCLRRHVMMRHLNYVYTCPYERCTHPGFKCSKALSAHIRSIHTHVRPYKCEHCDKCFVRRNDLRVHADIHNTVCEYICPVCKQMFQRRIHLHKHIRKYHRTLEC